MELDRVREEASEGQGGEVSLPPKRIARFQHTLLCPVALALPWCLCPVWDLYCGEIQKGSGENGDSMVGAGQDKGGRVRISSAQTPLMLRRNGDG